MFPRARPSLYAVPVLLVIGLVLHACGYIQP